MTPRVRSLRRWGPSGVRFGWGLADQAVSSLTNVAVQLVVAHVVLTQAEFGAFSAAFVTYPLALGVSRAITTEPLAVHGATMSHDEWHRASSGATALAAVVGLLAAAICGLVAWGLEGQDRSVFAALGVIMPALLVQDAYRGCFFVAARGRDAFVNDVVWAAGLAVGFAAAAAADRLSTSVAVLMWGAGAALACACGALQGRLVPRVGAGVQWARANRELSPRFALEFTAVSGSLQLYVFGIQTVLGNTAVAAVRGAQQLLLGPLNVLTMGIGMVVVPEASRALARSDRSLRLVVAGVTVAVTAASLGWGAVLLLVPDHWGVAVFGPTVWAAAQTVIVPILAMTILVNAKTGAYVGLRALAEAGRSLRARLVNSVCIVGGAVVGALLAGVQGAAWGLAVGAAVSGVVWWLEFGQAMRQRGASAARPFTGAAA